ncbi:DUF1097 domain-containing protein [Secundilactobacillus kimchicus]|uniref:DUF1097 domain-containing protein n=1 Tax=Secundilactobacillus kimchicus TaxID=528209 RepID=UPI001C031DD8|nr:DUF1097 domain-containing protein [Secundilactobacillus kimchicus]MBT9672179.1 DUF1097 domain-containing protein [Secundilactobacillus kimchicus]
MKVRKDVWLSSIGVGLFTLIFSLISSGFGLWMGAAAFIAASYFFGAGSPMDKLANISVSFILGIMWGALSTWLFTFPHLHDLWPSAFIFGFLTFLVLFLQGTIMPFTEVPAWLIAWGTTMLIVSNLPIDDWFVFGVELVICMYLGIFLIILGSAYFSKVINRLINKSPDHQ